MEIHDKMLWDAHYSWILLLRSDGTPLDWREMGAYFLARTVAKFQPRREHARV